MTKNITKNLKYIISSESNENGSLSTPYSRSETDKKFEQSQENLDKANNKLQEAIKKIEKMDYTLLAVVIILLVMVATLVIDSFHFNSTTYKEYSEKTEAVEITQKINQQLLEQNTKNQQMIIDLQTILEKNNICTTRKLSKDPYAI